MGTSLNLAWLSGNQISPGWPQFHLQLLPLHPMPADHLALLGFYVSMALL